MRPDEELYWWCNSCKDNVDVLLAYSIGVFCIKCGKEVTKPKNKPDITFFPTERDDNWSINDEDLRTI